MLQERQDLLAEANELNGFLDTLKDELRNGRSRPPAIRSFDRTIW